jgi:hypothetical protein
MTTVNSEFGFNRIYKIMAHNNFKRTTYFTGILNIHLQTSIFPKRFTVNWTRLEKVMVMRSCLQNTWSSSSQEVISGVPYLKCLQKVERSLVEYAAM